MRFLMLGPLRAFDEDREIALGGTKKRAALGFLLLQANNVVPTSHLLNALWPGDDAPISARKILQNAVWGLRSAFSADGRNAVRLLTQAPGYVLRLDPDQIDLHQFQQMAARGRSALISNEPARAATLLRDALALWQGNALADLVETGITWPEVTALENSRLDVLEDYFEAELKCGRHHSALSSLERFVQSDPLRERACGQLMLALYRCGRQADALSLYVRVRTALIEQLGLEPGRELQALQHAILTHDPALGGSPQPPDLTAGSLVEAAPDAEPTHVVDSAAVTMHRQVSAVLVRLQASPELANAAPVVVDGAMESALATIREQIDACRGSPVAAIGSVSLAVFGATGRQPDDTARAVRAGLTICDLLSPLADTGVIVSVAVATGRALVRYSTPAATVPLTVTGTLVDDCETLLSFAGPGEVRVCDATRRSTEATITYHRVGDPETGWTVVSAHPDQLARRPIAMVDPECELEVLRAFLSRVRNRRAPHLVTVLGEQGAGKTRLMSEFERRVAGMPEAASFLLCRLPPTTSEMAALMLYDTVSAYCGISRADPAWAVEDKLLRAVRRLANDNYEENWLLARLLPVVDPHRRTRGLPAAEVLAGWRRLMEFAAAERPLVLVIDDLHHADDMLLDLVNEFADPVNRVPLLMVVTARLDLLRRRPAWAGGWHHAVTITLDPLAATAADHAGLPMSTADGLTGTSQVRHDPVPLRPAVAAAWAAR